jgi:hypothetical protein
MLVLLKLQTVNQAIANSSTELKSLMNDNDRNPSPKRSIFSAKTQTSGIYSADDTDFSDADADDCIYMEKSNLTRDDPNDQSVMYAKHDYDRHLLYGYTRIEQKAKHIDFIR